MSVESPDWPARDPGPADAAYVRRFLTAQRGVRTRRRCHLNWQKRLAPQTRQCTQTLLPDTRIGGGVSAEFELRDRYRRQVDRLIASKSRNIGRGQQPAFHVDPDAGIHQEAHGSRTPLGSRSPSRPLARLSASQVAAASSGKVRYTSARASSAVSRPGPGTRRATWRWLRSITISSRSTASRSRISLRLRASSVAVMVLITSADFCNI